MNPVAPPLELTRCGACAALYVPTPAPCPRCGAHREVSESAPALGIVLAATELSNPPTGFTAPHRLALVELAEAVRLVAIVDGELPIPGDAVEVRREGETFRARP